MLQFIHSPVAGHLCVFQSIIMNKAALNFLIDIFWCTCFRVPLGYINLVVEMLDYKICANSSSQGSTQLFSTVVGPIYNPTTTM